MKEVWSREQRAAFLTAVLSTASGLGFVGDLDRAFPPFDVKTGETLWETSSALRSRDIRCHSQPAADSTLP